jgi:pyruvate dehydrogenase E2 component (dihydrolipoamide acetyltransferase)
VGSGNGQSSKKEPASMPTNVPLPALGESVTEGTVSRWLKQVGDTVEVDEPIVEVSTDKVDTEVPSPVAGTILEIVVPEDETAEVGATLAVIGDPSEAAAAPQQAAPAPAAAPTAPAPAAPAPAAPAPSAQAPAAGTEVTLPALGESVTEGTISRWLKAVGDTVEIDEPIVEVSTDKVDTEVPSPAAGTVLEIRVPEDETAEVGAVLAIIGDPNTAAPAAAPQAAPVPAAPAPAAPAAPAPAAPAPVAAAAPAPAAAPVSATPAPAAAPRRASDAPDAGYVTPLVRKLAQQNGVDLASVTGTGVGGRIRKQDVLDAAEAPAPVATAPAPAAPKAAAPVAKTATAEPSAKRGTTEKINRLRAVIAKRMTESLQTSRAAHRDGRGRCHQHQQAARQGEGRVQGSRGRVAVLPAVHLPGRGRGTQAVPEGQRQIDTEAGTITYPTPSISASRWTPTAACWSPSSRTRAISTSPDWPRRSAIWPPARGRTR